jgi:uncharacterized protein (DUF2141 family)
MKRYIIFLFSMSCAICYGQKNNLTIHVSNIQLNAGTVGVAVHNRQNFLANVYVQTSVLPAKNTDMTFAFALPKGEYAVAISQDYNGNGVLDKNLMGIPKEPYVFSNSVRPKFRAPTFDEAKFLIEEKTNLTQNLKLQNW